MGKLRVGVVGVGFISMEKHLPGLASNSDLCEIVAFCDFEIAKAEEGKAKFGTADAYTTTDYMRLVNDPNIDVIHVATWNISHCEISCAALEAGKHVMCEKPMAINGAEARRMVETAARTGKKLTIGYQNRMRDDSQFIRQIIDDGRLGEIYVAKGHATRRRGVPTWGVFTDASKQGGGPLIDIGTHALDLALWFMGNYEVDSVQGSVFHKLGDKPAGNQGGPWDPATYTVEDSAFGYVKMKNGATIILEASWALNIQQTREACVTLMGTEAGVDTVNSGAGYAVTLNEIVAGQQVVVKPVAGTQFQGAFGRPMTPFEYTGWLEVKQWLEAIINDTDPCVLPEQACVVTEVLEAIYNSSKTGQLIRF